MTIIKTIEEAKKLTYGSPHRRRDYVEGRCVEAIWDNKCWRTVQCSRKNGHGPGGLYCKQHAKLVEEQEGK